ncbi:MAG: FAD-dependent oxidoreductase [Thermoanaerobaculia bacterium]|nr:FAD-dependent oxidoreductase [Thermoanaerobaculia bacterium]
MNDSRYDVTVVGAGFAGLATAFHLSAADSPSIVVLEQREVPGAHASGRNAGMVLQSVPSPPLRRVVAASVRAYRERREEIGFEPVGSLLLGSDSTLEAVRDPELVASSWRSPREVKDRIPLLENHRFPRALETPSDGVMDVGRLLEHYRVGAQERGVELRLRTEVVRIESIPAGFRLQTSRGLVETGVLVNAAGAWAAPLGAEAGGRDLSLRPFKRHLFVLDGISLPSGSPFVWNLDEEFYVRNESGGVLASICDEDLSSNLAETVEPEMNLALAEKLGPLLQGVDRARIRTVWACHRTKAPDGLFVVGWDPVQEGLFWVAGLGGHGMGASWEIGRLAADALLAPSTAGDGPFDPARFP